jgi:hypothetical protein
MTWILALLLFVASADYPPNITTTTTVETTVPPPGPHLPEVR